MNECYTEIYHIQRQDPFAINMDLMNTLRLAIAELRTLLAKQTRNNNGIGKHVLHTLQSDLARLQSAPMNAYNALMMA